MMSSEHVREEKKIQAQGQQQKRPAYAEKLRSFWQGDVLWNCPMSYFTTFKAGGPADAVIMPAEVSELSRLVSGLNQHGIPWKVIGRGSNVLVPDKGFPGVVIVLVQPFSKIYKVLDTKESVSVCADAGCSLVRLVKWAEENGLTGIEFATGIPGSIGGALVMNAGAYGKEIGDVVSAVEVMDEEGVCHRIEKDMCHFSYRNLAIQYAGASDPVVLGKGTGLKSIKTIVLAGTFVLEKGKMEEVKALLHDVHCRRKQSQPQGVASAGSFFKNPEGKAAGKLIEEAGLKGLREGGAVVSTRHANFIVNAGGATASDILTLMQKVQEKVWAHSGIMLEPEVDVWASADGKHH